MQKPKARSIKYLIHNKGESREKKETNVNEGKIITTLLDYDLIKAQVQKWRCQSDKESLRKNNN